MPTNVEVNKLKINKMSEERLSQLETSGSIEPNQLYFTDDEDSKIVTETILWQHPTPNTYNQFKAQTITLSESVENFDYIKIGFIDMMHPDLNRPIMYQEFKLKSGQVSGALFCIQTDQKEGTFKMYHKNRQFNVPTSTTIEFEQGGENDAFANLQIVPIIIYGCRRERIDSGKLDGVCRTEVIYDRYISSKNWGHDGGIGPEIIVSGKDFSKYKALIIHGAENNVWQVNMILFLDYPGDENGFQTSVNGWGGLTYSCIVNQAKTSFKNSSSYPTAIIHKIIGVY